MAARSTARYFGVAMTGNYSVRAHASMLADEARVSAYAKAMESVVRPGCTVFEIGTGCGLFALYACELGASRVYAVEAESIYHVAREIIARSPHAAKVQLAHGMSTELSLPERVDVVFCDLHGALPFFGSHLMSIIDARTRHLKDGGALVPLRDSVWVAPGSCPELCRPYRLLSDAPLGIDLTPALPYATSRWTPRRTEKLLLLSAPRKWAEIDFSSVQSPNARGTAAFTADIDGEAHGWSVWFDCTLAEGVEFSNFPLDPPLVYGSAFFPFPEPVQVVEGDRLEVRLGTSLVEGDYIWQWQTAIMTADGQAKARFRQDSLQAEPTDIQELRTRAANHVPRPSESSDVEQFILARFDGERTNETIARELMARFASCFPSQQAALSRVAATAARHAARETKLDQVLPRRTDRE